MGEEKANSKNIVLDEKWAEGYIAWLQSLPPRNKKSRKPQRKRRINNMRHSTAAESEIRMYCAKISRIATKSNYLFCTFGIADKDCTSGRAFTRIPLNSNGNARLKHLYKATGLGFDFGNINTNHQKLIGRQLKIEVEHWKKDGIDLTMVKRFLSLG